jgi:hypothetical protein
MLMRALLALTLLLGGCSRLYYSSMEKLGREKRDILVQRIDAGRKDQEKAKKQFQTTLEAFQALTNFHGGDLEKTYKKLNGEYESAAGRARDVRERIESIEQVARDMFAEWDQEIGRMNNGELKNKSRVLRRKTEERYRPLIAKMRSVEKAMRPVLKKFEDQVLFLKHNLNASALQSLKTTATEIDGDVAALVRDIEASMKEADAFLESMPAN